MTEPMTREEYDRLLVSLNDGPTPDLVTFQRAEAFDSNFRWRVSEGHILNWLDMALEVVEDVQRWTRNHAKNTPALLADQEDPEL